MDCSVEERDGVTTLAPRGDFDRTTVGGFHARVDDLLRAGARYFVVDLGEVRFVDSTGLAALVRLYRRVRIGEGDVRLARVPPSVASVLELTRLNRVFDIFPSAAEAAATIRQQE
jgi:anti-sigma B factor antagonist